MMRTLGPLFIAFCLAGCSLLGDEETSWQNTTIEVPADTVAEVSASEGKAVFWFEGGLPVPCYAFEKADVEHAGDTTHVKVWASRTSEICITVTGRLRVEKLEVPVPAPGRRTFMFWRGSERPVTVAVTVP